MTIDQAIEVFVHGFAFGRSFTHPFLPQRVDHSIWALRDGPRKGGKYRCDLFVQAAHRRRRIATALMSGMLADDREAGASASVLLASHSGAKFYPLVGYENIGELLLYTPPKSRS